MHVSLKVFESHAELIECDMSEFWVESEACYSVVTLATTRSSSRARHAHVMLRGSIKTHYSQHCGSSVFKSFTPVSSYGC